MKAQDIAGLVEATLADYMATAPTRHRLLKSAVVRLPDNGSMDAAYESLKVACEAKGIELVGPWNAAGL